MDTSETYTKMADCEEIQKLRVSRPPWDTWQAGDFYYTSAPIKGCISVHNDASSYGLGLNTIWLPRQDQLQEMVVDKGLSPIQLASLFGNIQSEFLFNNRIRNLNFPSHKSSMEQLWLAFVMWEKYQKKWNGEKWDTTFA